MFKAFVSISLLSYTALIPLLGYADPTEPVVIVNDQTITQSDYDDYAKARAAQIRSKATPEPQMVIDELIQRELLRQAALQQKLDQTPQFQKQLTEIRNNLLMTMVMQDYLKKHPVEDTVLKQEYDEQVAKMTVPAEYKIRHILVETEAEAQTIIAELDQGSAFTELAKTKSTDPASAKQNGDLGWITKPKLEPALSTAVEKLEKGQYTTAPVKSKFGWHIVQLDDIREVPLPPFESVKERIRSKIQGQQMQAYLADLKKQAKIEILKPTEPAKTTAVEESTQNPSTESVQEPAQATITEPESTATTTEPESTQ